MKRVDEDRKERSEKGNEDDTLLVGRPQHDGHRNPGDGGDRAQHFRDRKQDLVRELEPSHHQPERNRDDRRQRKAKQDAAATQHHMHEESGIMQRARQAFIHGRRRGNIGEADEEDDAVILSVDARPEETPRARRRRQTPRAIRRD